VKGAGDKQGVQYFKQQEYEIIMEMSSQFPVKHLCDVLDINRSGFYKWKKRLEKTF